MYLFPKSILDRYYCIEANPIIKNYLSSLCHGFCSFISFESSNNIFNLEMKIRFEFSFSWFVLTRSIDSFHRRGIDLLQDEGAYSFHCRLVDM